MSEEKYVIVNGKKYFIENIERHLDSRNKYLEKKLAVQDIIITKIEDVDGPK